MKYRDLSQAEQVILPDAVASPVRGLCGPNRRPLESSDDYPDVVVMLDAKTRVIAADIQWIIQKRWGKEWRGELFFEGRIADVCAETDCTGIAGATRLVSRKRSGSQRR
jgi:hypothetical protein